MRGREPRFRVADRTLRQYPQFGQFFVMEFRDGAWGLYFVDGMAVTRSTRAEAQALADRLERGESIAEDQKRGPGSKSWRCQDK